MSIVNYFRIEIFGKSFEILTAYFLYLTFIIFKDATLLCVILIQEGDTISYNVFVAYLHSLCNYIIHLRT